MTRRPAILTETIARLGEVAKDYYPEHQHWVHGGDEGIDLCEECAVKEVARLAKKDPLKDYFVDGGWGVMESDGSAVCHDCGEPLSYTLTDYGTSEEFDHFKSIRLKFPFGEREAYELSAMLENIEGAKVTKTELRRFLNRKAFRQLRGAA